VLSYPHTDNMESYWQNTGLAEVNWFPRRGIEISAAYKMYTGRQPAPAKPSLDAEAALRRPSRFV